MQVDNINDDADLDSKELPQYTAEQLVQINKMEIDTNRAALVEEMRNHDKPNFKILEEFKKRVC